MVEFARLSRQLEEHRQLRELRLGLQTRFEATRLRIARELGDLGMADDPEAVRILAELLQRIRPKPVPEPLEAEAKRLNQLAGILAEMRRGDDGVAR